MATFFPYVISSSLLVLALLTPALLTPAMASTMPAADRLQSGLSLGSGPALGAQLNLDSRWQLGASFAVPFYFFQDFGTMRYGAYGLSRLLSQDGFFMAGVAGLYGDFSLSDPDRYSPLGLQLGAAFAYQLNRQLTLRLNLVPGVSLRLPPNGWVVFPPAGGAEIGWRWNDSFELSLGYNGNGDILGLNWIF